MTKKSVNKNPTDPSSNPLVSPFVALFRLHRKKALASEKLALLKSAYTYKLNSKLPSTPPGLSINAENNILAENISTLPNSNINIKELVNSSNNISSIQTSNKNFPIPKSKKQTHKKTVLLSPTYFEHSSLKTALDIVNKLLSKDTLMLFSEPVNSYYYNTPDYYLIIKEPMDLGTVKTKLLCGQYTPWFLEAIKSSEKFTKNSNNKQENKTESQKFWEDENPFVRDVRLIWQNAFRYNGENSEVAKSAMNLKKIFEGALAVARLEGVDGLTSYAENSDRVDKNEKLNIVEVKKEEKKISDKEKEIMIKENSTLIKEKKENNGKSFKIAEKGNEKAENKKNEVLGEKNKIEISKELKTKVEKKVKRYKEEDLYKIHKMKDDFFKLPKAKKTKLIEFLKEKKIPNFFLNDNTEKLNEMQIEKVEDILEEMLYRKEKRESQNEIHNVSFLEEGISNENELKREINKQSKNENKENSSKMVENSNANNENKKDQKEEEVSTMEDFFTNSEEDEEVVGF